jgi:hypothetical protein
MAKRTRKRKSPVWDHCTEKEGVVYCNYCDWKCERTSNSTSGINYHLGTTHKQSLEKLSKDMTREGEPSVLKLLTKPTIDHVKQEKIDKGIAQMLATDNMPFRSVEKPGFVEFMKMLEPTYKLPVKSTIKMSINDLYLERVEEVYFVIVCFLTIIFQLKKLTKAAAYPSYTADLWKSRTKEYYVAVTLHWIDDSWTLHGRPIALAHIVGRHTALHVGQCVGQQLKQFLGDGITPFAGVIDGGDVSSVPKTAE